MPTIFSRSYETPRKGRFSLRHVLHWGAAAILVMSWLNTEYFLPWISWHSEVVVFLAVLLLAWSAIVQTFSAGNRKTIALPFISYPFIALTLLIAIQRAAGLIPFTGDVWVSFFYSVLCVACLALGFAAASPGLARSADMETAVTPLAWALVAGALLSTLIGFAQVFDLWEGSPWIARMAELRRPGGNLGQPNHLATLQVMGIASLVFLRIPLGNLVRGLLLLLLCLGIAASESRTGALSVLALLCWWLLKRRAIGDPSPAWWGLVGAIAFLAVFLVWPYLLNAMDLLGSAVGTRTIEGTGRFQVWPQLLHAVTMRPWTGWGFHQVAAAHNAVVDQYAVSEPYSYSHNLVLDLLLWFGVPIGLLFVLMAGAYLWRRARSTTRLLPWYGLAVALPLTVHSLLEFPFAYAYFLAPTMFLLGAVEAATGALPPIRIKVKFAALFLAATTILMGWSGKEYLMIEEDFRVARFEAMRIGSRPLEYQSPRVTFFDQLGILLADARITPRRNMSPEDMQVVKGAALHYPWSATQYRYAVALALNGNPVEGRRQLAVIRRMWDAKVYAGITRKIDELAATEYPELRLLTVP